MKIRNNDGFTLVELLVTIVVASIVAAAAGTVLLMGIRLNANSTNTAQRQNTTRVFLSVMEDLAADGVLDKIVGTKEDNAAEGSENEVWYINGSDGDILFYYDPVSQTIYNGGSLATGNYTAGAPIIENVLSSYIEKKDHILTISLETEDGTYNSSVYCRNGAAVTYEEEVSEVIEDLTADGGLAEDALSGIDNRAARAEFLKALLSQLGSHGQIFGAEEGQPDFFSSWYSLGWPTDTPWCACYISWALDKTNGHVNTGEGNPVPKYANVDDFVAFFETKDDQNSDENKGYQWVSFEGDQNQDLLPNPGDIIFMDWTRQQKDAAHVGVVLAVKDEHIYTIEGNTANMVAVRKYPVGDPVLMGYGVIDWKPDPDSE